MKANELNNLKALVQGRELTLYQRSLAVNEFNNIIEYLNNNSCCDYCGNEVNLQIDAIVCGTCREKIGF